MTTITMVSHGNEEPTHIDLAQYATVESFMHKVFRRDSRPGETVSATASIPPVDTILDNTGMLLDSASRAIEFLSSRCGNLATELAQTKATCAEQIESVEHWRGLALQLQEKTTSLENENMAVTARYHTAEARLIKLEQAHKDVALRADHAELVTDKLQKQVEAAFGYGSHIRTAMDAAIRQADGLKES
ncbi:hypothetical protein [Lichenibacterium ramalinae]|uniref:Uncharacterized protein n=1 Tax=Lichenibacterium ramalinae TaxID=2316527 RepID=A0A4Q2RC04_9HYPH|nr:hypothetical protein [Lichenibacterium ramalinae]RYB03274.1 hypothetical protein D3272_17790 [Lichenibacterium ramalinae]